MNNKVLAVILIIILYHVTPEAQNMGVFDWIGFIVGLFLCGVLASGNKNE